MVVHKAKVTRRADGNFFKKLLFDEKFLTRSSATILTTIRSIDLEDFIFELTLKRNEELQDAKEKQTTIDESLRLLFKNVSSVEKIKTIEPSFYELHICDVHKQITNLREMLKYKYESAKKNEHLLEEEVKSLEKLCEKYDKDNFYKSLDTINFSPVKQNKRNPVLNKDIASFQEFLFSNGGHTGGWGEEEHKIFLKCWLRNRLDNRDPNEIFNDTKNIYSEKQLFDEVQRMIPEKSTEDIVAHVLWMLKYNRLKKQQSDAIADWRVLRSVTKLDKADLSQLELKAILKKSKSIDENNKNVKRWQTEKNADNRTTLECRADAAINERETQLTKEANRQKDKYIVSNWIESKRSEIENFRRSNQLDVKLKQRRASTEANKMIKIFRERDRLRNSLRLETINVHRQKLSRSLSSDHYTCRKNKVSPERRGSYAQFTKQWTSRIARNDLHASDGGNVGQISSIDDIPKLKMPSWCQGVNFR